MAFLAPSPVTPVVVTGADRAGYLDAVLSQRVEGLAEGEVAGALLLDQHGGPLAVMDVCVLVDRIVLLVPDRELASEVAETLGSRTFLKDARFALADLVTWSLRGTDAREVAGKAGLDPGVGAVTEEEDLLVAGRESGIDLVGPADPVDEAIEALVAAGTERADGERLETWRIEHGLPAWQREIRPPHLPEEAGLLPTHVHLAKGCYPGQEAVARMWNLGRPRRRLARVDVSGEAGAGWTTGKGRTQVEVTSAAPGDDPRPALAFVPPDAEPGDRYDDTTGAVVVRDLVGEGRPIPGHDPSVVRRRDRRDAE
ncbi:MAG: YgfZ/GcvT domain-containing protein [Nitriliruptorales bacterium]